MEDIDFSEDTDEIEVIYSDDEAEPDDCPVQINEGTFHQDNDEDFHVNDLSNLTFTKHTKAVFSCVLSKDGKYSVTGGEDDLAYVWSTSTGNVVLECTGHKDSVTSVCFNQDDQLLATADMGGMIQVWNIKDRKLIWCYEGDDMEWILWHHQSNILLYGSHSGDVYIWQVPQGNCKILASHGSPCTCGKILPDGKRLVTGYEDGQIKLWDMKSTNIQWSFSNTQAGGATSIEVNSLGSLISVAPYSNLLKVSDGKSIGTLLVEGETEVEAHLFNCELNVLITGSLTGQLCVWDLAKQIIRHQAKIECAVTVIGMGPNGKIFVGGADGAIYVCDIRTGSLIETLTGHTAEILSLSIASDGCLLVSTSEDTTAKVYCQKS